ncbi:MAG: hypothetical protein WC629_00915 [Candidatus Paceibacterota bacterium]
MQLYKTNELLTYRLPVKKPLILQLLISSAVFLATTNTAQNLIGQVNAETVAQSDVATSTATSTKMFDARTSGDIQDTVTAYFKDTPILAKIAKCESTFNQYNADGSVFRGRANNADVGVMQINEKYHALRAKKLGIDIHTLEGNLAYGKRLYKEEGVAPWSASKPCWGASASKAVVAVR